MSRNPDKVGFICLSIKKDPLGGSLPNNWFNSGSGELVHFLEKLALNLVNPCASDLELLGKFA